MLEDGIAEAEWPSLADGAADRTGLGRGPRRRSRDGSARTTDPEREAEALSRRLLHGRRAIPAPTRPSSRRPCRRRSRTGSPPSRRASKRSRPSARRRARSSARAPSSPLRRRSAGASERHKGRLGALDFDDLIDKTLELLSRGDAAWVLYKLDRGIDHVLVDEAQDTNPEQWEILRLMTEDFTAGAGARGTRGPDPVRGGRSQAVDLLLPGRRAAANSKRAAGSGSSGRATRSCASRRCPLTLSFRSANAVLTAVDATFGIAAHFKGLSFADAAVGTVHETRAARCARPRGIVADRDAGARGGARRLDASGRPAGPVLAGHRRGAERGAGDRPLDPSRRRMGPGVEARRHPGPDAAARPRLRGGDPRASGSGRAGRRAGPAQDRRAHRRARPRRRRPRRAAAAGRPDARRGAEVAARRPHRRRPHRGSRRTAPTDEALVAALDRHAESGEPAAAARTRGAAGTGRTSRGTTAPSASMSPCSDRMADARSSSRGSAARRATPSTSSSARPTRRKPDPRRPRSPRSWPATSRPADASPRAIRSSATSKPGATRCA